MKNHFLAMAVLLLLGATVTVAQSEDIAGINEAGHIGPHPAPPAATRSGVVQGTLEDGLTIYRGIPFAAPPVGDLRWRAPRPVAPWSSVLSANAFKPACMQPGPTLPGMMETYNEDCLYLNIWAPTQSAPKRLPVMVYIYGGGSLSGSGSARLYWGDHLARKGVIVVTLNYRVGTLGWLAHPELTKEAGTSGNYGLLDIVAALKWVRSNISTFGGDPNNVTLFGQSAGAYWESMLMVAPSAQGLFHRVIGAAGGDMGSRPDGSSFLKLQQAELQGVNYANKLGANTLAELRAIPADRIVALDASQERANGTSASAATAIIDGKIIPDIVRTLYREGKQSHVDLLVGANSDEGINTIGTPLAALDYIANIHATYGKFSDRLLTLYPASSDAEASTSQFRFAADDVAWREYSWAHFQAAAGIHNVYLYRFSSIPPFGQWSKLHAVGHGAELAYWFGYPDPKLLIAFEGSEKAALHTRIEDQIQTYWTNFAKTGDPNGAGLPRWAPFDTSHSEIMDLNDQFTMEPLPNKTAIDFLDAYHSSQ